MIPNKTIPCALALSALLTAPTVAHADAGVCEALQQEEEALERRLQRLSFDHPVVTAGVVACIDLADSGTDEERALKLGLCALTVCGLAGDETCTDVATRIGQIVLEEAAIVARRELAHCSNVPKPPVVTTPPPPATAGITIENRCDHPVRVAIRYADADRQWQSLGWWQVPAMVRTEHLAAGGRALQTRTATLYFYAETSDGSGWQWLGQHPTSVDGENLRMREIFDREGDTEIVLTCEP